MPALKSVTVVYTPAAEGGFSSIDAYASKDAAEAAVRDFKSNGLIDIESMELTLKREAGATPMKVGKANGSTAPKATTSASPKSPDFIFDSSDDGADAVAQETEAPKAKKGTSKKSEESKAARKVIPDGKPNVLRGVKVLFTGTFEMDRDTSKITAEHYGGTLVSKLEDADYIVLGTKPGPKKLETINAQRLETITEAQFYDLLKDGVPQEKHNQIAAKEAAAAVAEPPKKKQKK